MLNCWGIKNEKDKIEKLKYIYSGKLFINKISFSNEQYFLAYILFRFINFSNIETGCVQTHGFLVIYVSNFGHNEGKTHLPVVTRLT